ncbi:MAG: 2-oxoacid:acceptor oxidoreductase family protein, partial [Zoogloea sp.]|nr:2-oxoacid:acceptor oxidoreductase family protein [Zoogloea sp.]
GGSVFSHIRIADRPEDLHAVRIAAGEANAVIGGDVVVTASVDALAKMAVGRTRGVVNCAETPTSEFTRNPDWQFPLEKMQAAIVEAVGNDGCLFLDAQFLATRLLGDAIATNLFLLGYAWQKGWVPVSATSLDKAIELNGAAVDMNRQAFLWGRRAAVDLAAVEREVKPAPVIPIRPETLDERIARRAAFLTDYQDAAYARRYTDLVARVRAAEAPLGSERLTDAVMRHYFKLLACKDEYEVARLFSDPGFRAAVDSQFEGDFQLRFHLAPTFLARPDPASGRIRKLAFGPWMLTAFKWLARLRRLRGTPFDIFGYHPERKAERALVVEYEQDIVLLLAGLDAGRLPLAVEIASLPEGIRGYGHVKAAAIHSVAQQRKALLARWPDATGSRSRAA